MSSIIGRFLFEAMPFAGRRLYLRETAGQLTLLWIIRNIEQRLRKWDGYAKDAELIDAAIATFQPAQLEVLDMTESAIYTVQVSTFLEHRYAILLQVEAGEQWLLDRKHWTRTTLR